MINSEITIQRSTRNASDSPFRWRDIPSLDKTLIARVSILNLVGEFRRWLVAARRSPMGCAPRPVASGWSDCRVGLAPTGKRRLVTAHTQSGD